MYISYDDGNSWKSFQLNLPVVPITDLAIKNNDLIVGTQGRSIYILDDLTVIQQMNSGVLNKNLHVFDVNPAYRMPGGGRRGGGSGGGTTITNAGLNPPNGVVFNYYLKEITDSSKLSIELMDKNKKIIKTFSTSSKDNKIEIGKGMNQFEWDMNYPVAEKVDGLILWNGFVGGPKAAPEIIPQNSNRAKIQWKFLLSYCQTRIIKHHRQNTKNNSTTLLLSVISRQK